MRKRLCTLLAAAALSLSALSAEATTVTGTDLTGRSATAVFVIGSGSLEITLSNNGDDVLVPSDILTAVFFDLEGGPSLTPGSAVLTAGSTVLFDAAPAGGVVGGEWAYGAGLIGAPLGATRGISSAGFSLFGGANFPGPDLDPPAAINGLNYGITSAVDNPLTGNAAVTGGKPLIQSSVTFVLGMTGTITGLRNVSFQYGTALSEPRLFGCDNCDSFDIQVPEPSSGLSLGAGLAGLGLISVGLRRKRTT